MMNNQNASGTENVSDNNSLNPQINPGNINSSEKIGRASWRERV